MNAVAYGGLAMVLFGLGLLGRCILRAQAIRAGRVQGEGIEAALRRLIWQHSIAVAVAFFGLAVMVIGMVL